MKEKIRKKTKEIKEKIEVKMKSIKLTKVTSRVTIEFPKLNFSIQKGEVKKVPKEIEKEVLSNSNINKLN